MALLSNIDMTDVQELGEGFRIVPPGEYQVYITESSIEDTKGKKEGKNSNQFLLLKLAVCEGEYENSVVSVRLNLWNDNQQAVDIAKSQLRAICEATVQQPFVNDSSMLHSRPFFALIDNVPMNKDDPNSKRSNEVVFRKGTIRSINSGTTPGLAAGPAQQKTTAPKVAAAPAPVTPGSPLPPWKQKK